MAHIFSWFTDYMNVFWKWALFFGFNFMWITAWLDVLQAPPALVIASGISSAIGFVASFCNAVAKTL